MPATLKSTALELGTGEPLYKQIERDIMQCLAKGEWRPGAQLPTESELARRFGVAIYTVRAGIGELVTAGILVRRQGKGTFVARHERERERQRFSKVFDSENRKIIPSHESVASFEIDKADKLEAEMLCLDPRESIQVYRWVQILHDNERAISIRRVTAPVQLFPGLTESVLRNNSQNLYSLYQDLCGVSVTRIEDRVGATKADAHSASVLGVNRGDPLLQIDRVAFTYNDVPVEYRRRLYEGSGFYYYAELSGI
jgi:GntR family transcriptional regulator